MAMGLVININKKPTEPQVTTVSDIITRCNEAADKMGNGNPNKRVILDAAFCIRQLVDRLDKFDSGKGSVDLNPVEAADGQH